MTKKEILGSVLSIIVVCLVILSYQHFDNIHSSYKTPELALQHYNNPVPKVIDIIETHQFNDGKNAVIFYSSKLDDGQGTGGTATVKKFRYGWKVVQIGGFGYTPITKPSEYGEMQAGSHDILIGTCSNSVTGVTYAHQKAVLFPIKDTQLSFWVIYNFQQKENVQPAFIIE